LTKTEEEETIIINRPDRSTYPKEKSVLRSGATPVHAIRRVCLALAHSIVSGDIGV
jgi:hypothetical protein